MRDTKHKAKFEKLKNCQNEVLSIGFSKYVYNKLHEKFCIDTFELCSCFNCDIVFNEEEFQIWYINSNLGVMKQYNMCSIVYTMLLKDRNNTFFQYGYVKAVKNKTMIYRIFNSNTLLQ